MNGVHDLGGMHGFGPVEIEPHEPVFHSAWEARVFALNLASGYLGKWNIDMARYARERMPPAEYLAASYYERWLFGLEHLLVEQGLVTAKELASGRAEAIAEEARVLRSPDVATFVVGGHGHGGETSNRRSGRLDVEAAPKFKPGDQVLARNIEPVGHTRLPRYARGRRGVVERDHGVFTFPDTHAMSGDKKPQHCYSVRFAARELWGPSASDHDSVHLDLWDDHLDPA